MKNCLLSLHWMLLLILLAATGAYSDTLAPETIPGTTRINAGQLLDLFGARPDLALIDARISTDRKNGFIEGSVSLPDHDTDCATLAELLPSHQAPVAFYCNGEKCGRSGISAKIAVDCGYQAIYWFRGGIEEWNAERYPLLR